MSSIFINKYYSQITKEINHLRILCFVDIVRQLDFSMFHPEIKKILYLFLVLIYGSSKQIIITLSAKCNKYFAHSSL